jgi:hypothetical protein
MGTSSCNTKNCQGFSNELPGCSGANLIKNEDVANFIKNKNKDVANENSVKCGGMVEKCLKSASLIFINHVISGYFNSDVCNFD